MIAKKQLYDEIMELRDKIEKVKSELESLDTRMTCYKFCFVNWKYSTSDKRPLDYTKISIPVEFHNLKMASEKHFEKLDTLKNKIDEIDACISNYPNVDDMSDEEKIRFQLFLRDVIEVTLMGDEHSSLYTGLAGEYIREVGLLEKSINWEKGTADSQDSQSVVVFGDTYVYKPKHFKSFIRRLFGISVNEFDYPNSHQISQFENLQSMFSHYITDENNVRDYLVRARQNYIFQYQAEENSRDYETVRAQLDIVSDLYSSRLHNQKRAAILRIQLNNLTTEYEEKMELLSSMEEKPATKNSQVVGKTHCKR
ncbi:MAG: hypothetical protein IKF82_03670 [Bacilli bacterium]|nr:hypothetical protein [Bacilli bacterium]